MFKCYSTTAERTFPRARTTQIEKGATTTVRDKGMTGARDDVVWATAVEPQIMRSTLFQPLYGNLFAGVRLARYFCCGWCQLVRLQAAYGRDQREEQDNVN